MSDTAKTVQTVIYKEASTPLPPAYPLPLICEVQVQEGASEDEIRRLVAMDRAQDLGIEDDPVTVSKIAEGIQLLFSFSGSHGTLNDWRD